MPVPPDVPETIQNAVLHIRRLLAKPVPTRMDMETIHNLRLKIVFWACAAENVAPTRDNLAYVLGPDAREVMAAYDRKLKDQKEHGVGPRPDTETGFWDK